MSIRHATIALIVSLLSACVAPKPAPTPLEIQAIQSHEFETDKTMALGAVISVFQDLGYIVQSADKDTGFVTANSPAGSKTNFWEAIGGMSSSGQTKATAFIEQIRPNFVTVRLNFVDSRRVSNQVGQVTDEDQPILDPKTYQIAFDKIDSAIFVRTGARGTGPAATASSTQQ